MKTHYDSWCVASIGSLCSNSELQCWTLDPYLQEKNKAAGQWCCCAVSTEYCCPYLSILWTGRVVWVLVYFFACFFDCLCYYLALFPSAFTVVHFSLQFILFHGTSRFGKQLALLLWYVVPAYCFSSWKEVWILKPHDCKQVLST